MAADQPMEAERHGFEATALTEARPLFALAFSMLRDVAEAEDAVQDTLEIAWRTWGSLREREHPSAWLRRICIRRCMRIRRGLFRRAVLSDGAAPASDRLSVDPDLDRAFRRLTASQRAVVALHYRYGFTLDESAALMGCRPGTARSHLNRALRTLRKELGDEQA